MTYLLCNHKKAMSLWSKSAFPKEFASGRSSLTDKHWRFMWNSFCKNCTRSFLQHEACTWDFWLDPPIAPGRSNIPFTGLNDCMTLDLWLPSSWYQRIVMVIMQYMLDLLLVCAGESMIEAEVELLDYRWQWDWYDFTMWLWNLFSYCIAPDGCEDGKLELVGGKIEQEGFVKVCKDGVWGSLCLSSDDYKTGRVVCSRLGHKGRSEC